MIFNSLDLHVQLERFTKQIMSENFPIILLLFIIEDRSEYIVLELMFIVHAKLLTILEFSTIN